MPAFCWQEKAALRFLREKFKPSEVVTATAVYVTLTELASNNQADEFRVKRQTLGDMIGRSVDSIDIYLSRLEEIGLVEKRAIVIDNEYKCIAIRLLPRPATTECTRPPAESAPLVAEPTRPPTSIPSATPPNPLGIELEESSPKKNLHVESAGSPPASRPDLPSTRSADGGAGPPPPPEAAEPPSPGQGATRLHFGPRVPGSLNPASHENPDELEKHRPKPGGRQAVEPKPPEKWAGVQALAYFRQKFMERWKGEGAPAWREKDVLATQRRITWLKTEGLSVALMKSVIDHIFEKWSNGLPSRFKWEGTRPGYALIEHTVMFERLIREVQNGVPDPAKKIDSWDEESGKRQPKIGWGKK
jgi:hypothetical protein